MKTKELRKLFLEYFKKQGHNVLPSSSLVPINDPTLLFTNAGMVQFKEIFLGNEPSSCKRAVTVQRCVRAGGKHNDLENVGHTARHHTFFEMLGNFSFGDYFKREAIHYSWEFLTKILKIPKEKLWVTVYLDDDESAQIWLKEIGIPKERFSRCGESDNFWSMGDTGPCGPCSEIFYDHGASIPGGPPGTPEQDGDRYVEIWNLVFMQFNRNAKGELTPLPKPSVDTGMGLERIAAVMQGVHNNYDIDLFQHIIQAILPLTPLADPEVSSLRVIADHIRSCAFLIADGVIPANEGRGYVLRRIMRRALRHGNKLDIQEPFFYRLVAPLVTEMGEAYPELGKAQTRIENLLLQEEEQFAKTLTQGLKILEQDIATLDGNVLPGETIFKLYDTYGFPADLTGDIARERGLLLDMEGFEKAMQEQRQRSQSLSQFAVDYNETPYIGLETAFTGYEELAHASKVIALLHEGKSVKQLKAGEEGCVVLDRSPFYAESGGQVGDRGYLKFTKGLFEVVDTKKQQQSHLHYGKLQTGQLSIGMEVEAAVDVINRQAIMLNHSATHLLHAALRRILGDQLVQKGSLVEAERLRFDFAYPKALTLEEIHQIEQLVNCEIRSNYSSVTEIMSSDTAKQSGAIALFGEKYGDKVRVLSMGNFSKELCGGTHVKHVGDIGFFKIISEEGIAAGIRRIEAVTGDKAVHWAESLEQQISSISSLMKCHPEQTLDKIKQLLKQNRELEKQLEKMQTNVAVNAGTDLALQAQDIAGIKVLVAKLLDVEPKSLRNTIDQLKNKLGHAVIVLASVKDNRLNVIAGVTKNCITKVPKPRDLVVAICGKGGGREDMAEGGGEIVPDLDARIEKVKAMIKDFLLTG